MTALTPEQAIAEALKLDALLSALKPAPLGPIPSPPPMSAREALERKLKDAEALSEMLKHSDKTPNRSEYWAAMKETNRIRIARDAIPRPRSTPAAAADGVSLPPNVPPDTVAGPSLLSASRVEPQGVNWLWDEWLALGKFHIFAGEPGTAKSTITFSLGATVSTGGKWPDGSKCTSAGNVLIWSGEDDPADTIIPRLIAAGANLERVHLVYGASSPDGKTYLPFDPSRDVPQLRAEITRIGGVALLIIDPIVSAVAGDMHKANDVRRGLQALVDFGAEFDCAIIGISHFSKGSGGNNPTERVIGSQAFGALARVVIVCAKNEDNTLRVMMRTKSNIGPDLGGFKYKLELLTLPATETRAAIATVRITWDGSIAGAARAVLKSLEPAKEHEGGERGECMAAMRDLLTGPDGRPIEVDCREVQTKLEDAGYSEKRIRTAKERLGVTFRHEGFPKVTYWKLQPTTLEPSPGFLDSKGGVQ